MSGLRIIDRPRPMPPPPALNRLDCLSDGTRRWGQARGLSDLETNAAIERMVAKLDESPDSTEQAVDRALSSIKSGALAHGDIDIATVMELL